MFPVKKNIKIKSHGVLEKERERERERETRRGGESERERGVVATLACTIGELVHFADFALHHYYVPHKVHANSAEFETLHTEMKR